VQAEIDAPIDPDPIIIIEPETTSTTTIDLWNAFPAYQGQNNFFAYRYDGSSYTALLPNTNGTDLSFTLGGGPSDPSGIPIVERDQNPVHPVNSGPWLFLHPGEEDAVLGWMAPSDLYADIDLTFLHPSGAGGNGINAYVKMNDQTIDSIDILNNSFGFSNDDIFLNAGDFLYFGINTNGPSEYDWGHLKGTITYEVAANPVPLPGSILLFGSALTGIGVIRRKIGRGLK
jgi:hypothetical protein